MVELLEQKRLGAIVHSDCDFGLKNLSACNLPDAMGHIDTNGVHPGIKLK